VSVAPSSGPDLDEVKTSWATSLRGIGANGSDESHRSLPQTLGEDISGGSEVKKSSGKCFAMDRTLLWHTASGGDDRESRDEASDTSRRSKATLLARSVVHDARNVIAISA
jgi:hypothetical protein